MPSPDWKTAKSYGFDPKKFSYRQYAWEFLRRNPDFQRESAHALQFGSERERAKVATKYGLRDLVSHLHIYELGKSELVWLAEVLCEPAFPHKKNQTNVIQTQRPGEVALVFDLDATVSSGPAAIDAFLWDARRMLMEERTRFIATLPRNEARVVRVKSPRIRKAKLFDWLRTYDAVEHMGVSQKEAAEVLHPDDFVPDKFTKKTKGLAAQKKVSDDRKRAMSLVSNEYLALVPLDYLQDKSKR
ncbi:hypothetical protein HSX11_02380 [Oxalobacteraceae bacterium]|nr:hypothetical protein [Oxalobacteraceae bacterium]